MLFVLDTDKKPYIKMNDKQFLWTLIIMACMYFCGIIAKEHLTFIGQIIMFAGISFIYLLICGRSNNKESKCKMKN